MRNIKFKTGEYYHVYNRGVDKREIFCDEKDYGRFLTSMKEFNRIEPIDSLHMLEKRRLASKELGSLAKEPSSFPRLVDIVCYCLNPNHYHLLVKQLSDKGIPKFMHKVGLGYTNYFNGKNKRSGSLFQGKFKAVMIKSGWQLNYVSAYINGNPEIHGIGKAEEWLWSSYRDYLELRDSDLCNKEVVLKEFKNVSEYRKYVKESVKGSKEIKKEYKKYSLEW